MKYKRLTHWLLLSLGCISFSLLFAEAITAFRVNFSYPALNIFEVNPSYGVRLIPNTTTRLRSPLGHVSTIQTDAFGFRGRPPNQNKANTSIDILVVGDSLVFGYGVNADETFVEQLQVQLGANHTKENFEPTTQPLTYNAGVPTWGMNEYNQIIAELAPILHPKVIVVGLSAANDWFEVNAKNTRRHTAENGWAKTYRKQTPPSLSKKSSSLDKSISWIKQYSQLYYHFARARGSFSSSKLLIKTQKIKKAPLPNFAKTIANKFNEMNSPAPGFTSKLGEKMAALTETANHVGAKLVFVIFPLDLQISTKEAKKYATNAPSIEYTVTLFDRVKIDAKFLGAEFVDLTSTFRNTSLSAFLTDDYHLSPHGHALTSKRLAPVIERLLKTKATL